MKGNKSKSDSGLSSAKKWITLRVSLEEKERLAGQADIAGLSVSEYMRRRFFGGRPLIAHTDELVVRELRRLGGLLKHNFETLRQSGASPECIKNQENVLRLLVLTIEKIGTARYDR